MKIEKIQYVTGQGWTCDTFPTLDSENTLVLIFGASKYLDDTGPIAELSAAYPKSKMIGCSSAGEIFGPAIVDGSLSVAIAQFDRTQLKSTVVDVDSAEDSNSAGARIAEKLRAPNLKSVIVLSDGLSVNGSELVKGITSNVGEEVITTGGLAGDGDAFQRTWVLSDETNGPVSNKIVAIGLYGSELQVGFGSRGGWDIFGPERTITKSKDNILYEIDGKPALSLYKTYLGDRANELPASALLFPLTIRQDTQTDEQIVRTILSVDEEEQSMTFAGDVPQNWRAQLMKANFDRLIDGAYNAGIQATLNPPSVQDTLSIAISCVGRRIILGERAEEETEAISDCFSDETQMVGFYSYGEISPNQFSNCDLHNQTMTITTIREYP